MKTHAGSGVGELSEASEEGKLPGKDAEKNIALVTINKDRRAKGGKSHQHPWKEMCERS